MKKINAIQDKFQYKMQIWHRKSHNRQKIEHRGFNKIPKLTCLVTLAHWPDTFRAVKARIISNAVPKRCMNKASMHTWPQLTAGKEGAISHETNVSRNRNNCLSCSYNIQAPEQTYFCQYRCLKSTQLHRKAIFSEFP